MQAGPLPSCGLFLRALDSRQEAAQAKRLAEGLEGVWGKDLAVVKAILKTVDTSRFGA